MSKIKFAPRVKLVSEGYGIVRVVHAEEAQRIFDKGRAQRVKPGKRIDELLLVDHRPEVQSGGHSSNSLRAGYMESLPGGEAIQITTDRSDRSVTTGPCRVYKLKAIPKGVEDIYRNVVLENKVPCPC